jgi:hypothetical protein
MNRLRVSVTSLLILKGCASVEDMAAALVQSVESPPNQVRMVDVPSIRSAISTTPRKIAGARTVSE